MLSMMILSCAIALVAAVFFIRWARGHSKRYAQWIPQRFHVGDVPRVGGLAILIGTAAGWIFGAVSSSGEDALNVRLTWSFVGAWLAAVVPVVLGGAYEDMSQRVPVVVRLGLTGLSAALACWLLDLSVVRLSLPFVDGALAAVPWLAVLVAFVAISGLPHAFNIIDGYNGLAGTVTLLISLALAHVAMQVGDRSLAAILLCTAGATAGFLFWNYPRGLIFAGDGGAYLWGVVIAISSILLVKHHAEVSPWFPMLLLIYPVWETVFSIYRKLARGQSPGLADALHFHQLIYRRIVRGVFHDDEARRVLMRNNRTSPYLWGFTAFSVAPAVLFWKNTPVLMAFCALFVVTYVASYLMIVRFKVPRWLRRSR